MKRVQIIYGFAFEIELCTQSTTPYALTPDGLLRVYTYQNMEEPNIRKRMRMETKQCNTKKRNGKV